MTGSGPSARAEDLSGRGNETTGRAGPSSGPTGPRPPRSGSTSVGAFIERNQPEYFFCGHIHEAEGKSMRIGRTFAVNVGKAGYTLDL